MFKNLIIRCYLILLLIFFSCSTTTEVEIHDDTIREPVFKLLLPSTSGIMFANKLQHNVTTKANLFDFDYFYNGAGVGIGDINNDGLQDIFFCGNQVKNKLFLNKGNMKFEDITETAGINSNKHWSNGVVFADVNDDGWLDIYANCGFISQDRSRPDG